MHLRRVGGFAGNPRAETGACADVLCDGSAAAWCGKNRARRSCTGTPAGAHETEARVPRRTHVGALGITNARLNRRYRQTRRGVRPLAARQAATAKRTCRLHSLVIGLALAPHRDVLESESSHQHRENPEHCQPSLGGRKGGNSGALVKTEKSGRFPRAPLCAVRGECNRDCESVTGGRRRTAWDRTTRRRKSRRRRSTQSRSSRASRSSAASPSGW